MLNIHPLHKLVNQEIRFPDHAGIYNIALTDSDKEALLFESCNICPEDYKALFEYAKTTTIIVHEVDRDGDFLIRVPVGTQFYHYWLPHEILQIQ